MAYKKINLELIVFADDAEAVVVELNAALDKLEERHTIFGGGIEGVSVEHSGTRKKSALMHTQAAGKPQPMPSTWQARRCWRPPQNHLTQAQLTSGALPIAGREFPQTI